MKNFKKKIKLFFSTFTLVGFLIVPYFVFADSKALERLKSVGGNAGFNEQDPRLIIAGVIKIFLGFLGIIFVILMIYAGYNYLTAQGDEEKIKTALATIRRAIIGLLIVLSSWAITTFITNSIVTSVAS